MFKKIIAAAKAFFVKVFTRSTTSVPPATSEQQLEHVIKIVDAVKDAVNSRLAVVITALIPGTIDNYIRATASMILPAAIAGLTYIKGKLNTLDETALLNEALDKVRFSDVEDQNAFYHSLAARLLVIFSDGKVTWSEAVGIVEYYFKNKYLKTI